MVVALVCVAVVLGIYPADRTVWCVEMVWAVGLWEILFLTRRKFRFSTPAYLCFFVWTVLQIVGAHYTFEHVPMEWLMRPLGLVRNPYDRIAHFAVGWFAFPLAELFFRKGWAKSAGFAAFFAVMSTVAMAGIWELVEWWYAVVDGGEAGAAFLGSQGDVWDAQKDILCDTLGAICSSGLFLWCDRKDPLYWAPKVHGVAVLNPENDAPTAIWMRSRMKHQWIWDIVGVALIMSVISAIIGLLWLCAIGIRNLESRFLWPDALRVIPVASELPIRDFKWDELRLGDVAGMEERYSTRIGKVFSPSGGVAPKIDVAKYMKELRLPAVSFKPPATLADALLYLQSASAPFDGSGRVVLFALMPKEEGEVYPTVPEISAEDILFADILRLVCESTDARYVIRDDGAVVVWPPDFCCECNYMPGEEWRLPIGTWPRRSSFEEGCRGKVFRQD
jgi:putative membrane protein